MNNNLIAPKYEIQKDHKCSDACLITCDCGNSVCEFDECEDCCLHDDVCYDERVCLDCGIDLSEQLSIKAYDNYKACEE